jgi:hypothetical protein
LEKPRGRKRKTTLPYLHGQNIKMALGMPWPAVDRGSGSSAWPRDALGGTGDKGWDGILQGHSPMGRMWRSGWNFKHGGQTAGARPAGRLLVTATALR